MHYAADYIDRDVWLKQIAYLIQNEGSDEPKWDITVALMGRVKVNGVKLNTGFENEQSSVIRYPIELL
jgi:hypothetical protein